MTKTKNYYVQLINGPSTDYGYNAHGLTRSAWNVEIVAMGKTWRDKEVVFCRKFFDHGEAMALYEKMNRASTLSEAKQAAI